MHLILRQNELNVFRWIAVLCSALVVTTFLFLLMKVLISVEFKEAEGSVIYKPENLTYVENEIEKIPISKPKEPPVAPEPPQAPEYVAEQYVDENFSMPSIVIAARLQQKPNFVMTGMPVPVYLTAAKYPRDALRKGLEGYVDVRFDITKMGATDNISVLAADPQGYFERSAIDAVTSWRYQPQMVDGDPARFEGMSKRIKFVMSQEK